MSAPDRRGPPWTHHPACPGALPHEWWAQPLRTYVIGDEAIEQWQCVACGSHVSRTALYPVVVPAAVRP